MQAEDIQDGKRQRTDADGPASSFENVEAILAEAMAGFSKAQEAVSAEREQLRMDREALEAEKAAMMTLSVTENDLIELNVGGTRIATKRSTLCQAEGSVLAAIFSGRWEGRMEKDSQGATFLDVDPYCMSEFLSYLRRQKLTPPDKKVSLPEISKERKEDWQLFLEFFGLHDYLYGVSTYPELRFDRCSGNLVLDTDGKVSHRGNGYGFALCSIPLTATAVWRVKMTLPGGIWCVLGVRGNVNPSDTSYADNTTHGWGGQDAKVLLKRMPTPACDGWKSFNNDDEVFMRLDMTASKLQMRLTRQPLSFTLDLPREMNAWYVQANVYFTNTALEMRTATAEEVARWFP